MLAKRKSLVDLEANGLGQSPTNALQGIQGIPRYVQYTSPVASSLPRDGTPRASVLPLNLIALIVSYLDDIGDIARVTRTSRLLYYMTVPQLYKHVDLHSYAEMRYINGRPEGFGGGSPLMMALNGLVTKGHSDLVRDFRLWGHWRELGIEDFAKGRVPDNSMMLNILLRAATDKMSKLQSFCWELDCKPLKTLYTGLGAHTTLTSLTLRFPSTRTPRPSVLVPPMANLRVLKALHIDPMCYPDDISLLILHAKKLEDLRLHFSPRMRDEGEAVMNLNMFFGRCHQANYKIPVKHFALQNFFGPNVLGMDQIFDVETCRSVTFLDTFGNNDARTVFVDDTWKNVPSDLYTNFRSVRINELTPQHVQIMKTTGTKMERFYVVNAKRSKTGSTTTSRSITPFAEIPTPDPEVVPLGREYLYTLTRYHGETLKHLLLSDQWVLSQSEMADLVRHCPNLEQLGLAIDTHNHDVSRLLYPFLTQLRALRLLQNEHLVEHMSFVTHEERMWQMGRDLAVRPLPRLEVFGLGDFVYKLGKVVDFTKEDGSIEPRREMFMVDKQEAQQFELWRLDALDISLDPIIRFTP